MALIELTPDLLVDNKFIDEDHTKLIKLINDFHSAMEQGRGNEVVYKVLHNLSVYTANHFAREEAEMARIHYVNAIAHKREHTRLLTEVNNLIANFKDGKTMMTITISKFLKEWLVNHINQTDKLFAKALNSY